MFQNGGRSVMAICPGCGEQAPPLRAPNGRRDAVCSPCAFPFGKVVVKPVPRANCMHPTRGIPVDALAILITLLVVVDACFQQSFRQVKIAVVIRHEKRKCGLRGVDAEVTGLVLGMRLDKSSIDRRLQSPPRELLRSERTLLHGRPGVVVEKETRMIFANLTCPVGQILGEARLELQPDDTDQQADDQRFPRHGSFSLSNVRCHQSRYSPLGQRLKRLQTRNADYCTNVVRRPR